MAKSIYFNTNASSPAVALCKDANGFPTGNRLEFVLGDKKTLQFYLVDGAGNYDAASGTAGYTPKLGIGTPGNVPTGGTYTISDGTDTTSALAHNATSTQIQTALNALNTSTGPYGGTVTVTGTFPNYRVTWDANGAHAALTTTSTSLTPTSTAVVSTATDGDGSTQEVQLIHLHRAPAVLQTSFSTITNGWSAVVDFSTFELRELVGTSQTFNASLEFEVTDSGGNRITHVQVPVVIRHEVVDEASIASTTLGTAISTTEAQNQFLQNRSTITGLTGGTSADLDSIATTTVTVGWLAAVKTTDTVYSVYRLVSGTDAESSPDVIRPDDYATTTNEKVWKLQAVSTSTFFTHETISAFSSAGNDDVTLGVNGLHHVAYLTASAGAGTYTRTISLLTTNATNGDIISLRAAMPASTNPTVEIRNASSVGTLLTSFTGDGSTGTVHGTYQYTGSAWVEVAANWI